MSKPPSAAKRLLDPIERTSEVLFGLIMALTFTCSISVAEAGRAEVRTVLIGALGCNIAWGLIDAVIYLMTSLTERARGLATLRAVRQTTNPEEARIIIAGALPSVVAVTMAEDDLDKIRRGLALTTEPPASPRLRKNDYIAALGVFILVFLATFPMIVPFIFISDAISALRISNGIALVMLFLAGHSFGRYAQYRPVRLGLIMMLTGSVLVVITIALGG